MRSDVQGLRAVAVILVALYHTGVLPGGFIGVDVFFVISGFVITKSIISGNTQDLRASLFAFYAKRLRRILPALYLVVLFVVIISWFGGYWLPHRDISQTALAALLSVSNLVFLTQESGYFSTGPELNPLLHTWSLGVEEQIYLVFPIVLLALLRLTRLTRNIVLVLTALALGSFITELWLTWGPPILFGREPRLIAFFFPGTRIWEFLVGSIIAVSLPETVRTRVRDPLWIALTITSLTVTSLVVDNRSIFPGWIAAFPVAATAVIIVLGSAPGSSAHYILGHRSVFGRFMGWLGDRSYGWYLWHWPVLLLVNQSIAGRDSQLMALVAVLSALVPAHLSYVYVEQRWRGSIALPKSRRLAGAGILVTTALIVGANAAGAISVGRPTTESWTQEQWLLGDCQVAEEDCIDPDAFVSQTVFLIGDSHAGALAQALRSIADQLNVPLVVAARAGCPFVDADWGFFLDQFREASRTTNHYCREHYQDVLTMIQKTPDPVVVMADYAALFAGSRELAPRFDLRVVCPIVQGGDCQSPNTQNARQTFFLESLSQSLNQILIRGGNVLFVGAAPVMFREQADMESEGELRGTARSLSSAIVGASDDFRQDLSRTAPPGRVAFIDLHRLLCTDDLCPFSRGDELLFTTAGSANDHLSVQGAQEIQDEILRRITRLLD